MSLILSSMLQAAALMSDGGAVSAIPVAQEPFVAEEGFQAQFARARALAVDPEQREQAISRYTELLERSPGNSDVLLARGRTYAWMKRYPEAEADLKAVTVGKPDYVEGWSALGDMYLWSDRPADAAAAYTRWMELAPGDANAAMARGRAHRAAGDVAGSRADFAAAGVRGAVAGEVTRLQTSLAPWQAATSDAVINDANRWLLRAGIDQTGFSGNRADWTDSEVSLRRRFDRGSLALEWLQAHRFERTNSAFALDGYAGLWSRAYANARYQHGSGILPRDAWRLELFQGVGKGWELSASIDHLRFSSDTEFYGIGVGRYVGNWYARYKLQHVPGVGYGSWSHRMLVRNYYRGDADDYFEVSVGEGRSSDLDRLGGVVQDSNASVGLAWMHYVRPQWGFKLGAGYADADGFDQRRVSVTLYARW